MPAKSLDLLTASDPLHRKITAKLNGIKKGYYYLSSEFTKELGYSSSVLRAWYVRYPELWADHSLDMTVAPQPETDNYMTLEVSGNTLRLAAFLPDCKQIDKVEIKK